MAQVASRLGGTKVGDFVEDYEAAQARGGCADPAAFLPERDHPLYLPVLRELIRVDLEYHWEHRQPRRLEAYAGAFPDILRDPDGLREIAFEEYRLRYQAGDGPSPDEYQRRFGVDTSGWPILPGLPGPHSDFRSRLPTPSRNGMLSVAQAESESHEAGQYAHAAAEIPRQGSVFQGFRLVAEIGRGAFARVYLAQQGELADRLVVVKIAPRLTGEAQTLARLQHTHIVPIYSVHRSDSFQAFCMPFLGTTTLAHVLKALRGGTELPASGKGLVHTLDACRSVTHIEPPSVLPAPASLTDAEHLPTPEVRPSWKELLGLTYVEAVLWLGVRLADGLAHAHERGILHRDLKPANILLTDDGQPMLLDFNLAHDSTRNADATAAQVGGTLPYMAPEHLQAFQGQPQTVDARCDLYSLGIILFELLTGHPPFPLHHGPIRDLLPRLLVDRLQGPPALRVLNKAVSPAVESIVRHCLEPAPERRYQSAQQLREDLQHQLDHLPLRYAPEPSLRERFSKWRSRHPRLTSTAAVAMAAALLLLVVSTLGLVSTRRQARLGAVDTFLQFREQFGQVRMTLTTPDSSPKQLEEGLALAQHVFARYRVLETPSWYEADAVRTLADADREWLRVHVGELLLHCARVTLHRADRLDKSSARREQLAHALQLNERAEKSYPPDECPRALWQQRARLFELAGRSDEAKSLAKQAEQMPPHPTRDLPLAVADLAAQGRIREALSLLRQKHEGERRDYWYWLALGNYHGMLSQLTQAGNCYQRAIELQPRSYLPYVNRGLAYLDQKEYDQACADFDQVVELRPDLMEVYYNRALARYGAANQAGALDDLTHILESPRPTTRAWFLRARIRAQQGDVPGARQDQQLGLRCEPTDEKDWITRALARLPRDAQGALNDLNKALELNPRSRTALQNKAHVLAEKLGRTAEAVELLDQAVAFYPDYVPARAGRGVLLARLGRREAAHADAKEALARDRTPATFYQVAGVYALTSKQNAADRSEAFRLLATALRQGYGLDLLEKDTDLDPLRAEAEFRQLVEAARALRTGT